MPYESHEGLVLLLALTLLGQDTPSFTSVCSTPYLVTLLASLHQLLTLRLLISYIYGAPSKARNANVVYIWTYVWQR